MLSANKYKDTDRSHRLEWVEFANGGRLNYAYDDFDRVTGISFDAADPYTNPRYKYAYGANGQVAYVTDTHLQRTHWAEYDQAGRAMQSTTWDGLFDAAGPNRGNLLYRTTLKYDKSNRLVLFGEKVPGADKPKRQEKRDSKGKVVKVNGEVQYEYISDDDGTDNITTKYAYDADDRLTKITFDDKKDERSVKYEYDKLGRVSKMTVTNGGEDVPVDPDEESERDSDRVKNEKSNKISYIFAKGGQGTNSQSTRITQMSHTASGILPIDYVYDTVGNITQETADLFEGGNNSYKYDKLGQLIRANVRHDPTCDTLLGTTWVYTYDRGGNILKKEGYPYTTFTLPETPTKTIVYGYDHDGRTLPDLSARPNWKDQLTSYGELGNAKAIHYPAEQFDIGNPVAYDGWAFTWQAGRKLARMCKYNGEVSPAGVGAAEYGTFSVDTGDMSVAHTQGSAGHTFSLNGGDLSVNAPGYELNNGQLQASVELGQPELTIDYSYDASGLRTQKKVTQHGVTTTTNYILHGKNLMHMKKTAGGTSEQLHFYYANGKPVMVRVGVEEADCKYYTYVYNLQGDVLGILDSEQKPVVQYRYDPWGKSLGIFGPMKDTLGKLNPFRYRGYLYDDETDLYYLRSRYYNPEWGRFVNEDSIIGKTGKLFAHNMFAYCRNNPVALVDPTGCSPSFFERAGNLGKALAKEYARLNVWFYGSAAAVIRTGSMSTAETYTNFLYGRGKTLSDSTKAMLTEAMQNSEYLKQKIKRDYQKHGPIIGYYGPKILRFPQRERILNLSLGKTRYWATITENDDGKLHASVLVYDDYNFDELRLKDAKGYHPSVSNFANDIGYMIQTAGLGSEYSWSIHFQMDLDEEVAD